MSNKTIFLLAAVIAIAVSGFLLYMRRPPYPKNWDRITIGMPAPEAQKCEPALSSEMRDLKGFDQCSIDFGDRAWTLVVGIDANTNIQYISKMYVFKPCGIWNKTIFENEKQ